MKKETLSWIYYVQKTRIKQFLRIMRITLVLLFVGIFFVSARDSYSQNVRVNINKSRVTLDEILNEIESQTDYLFLYNTQVDVNRKVTVKAKNKPVSQVLQSIFKDTDIDFAMEGTHIVLTKNKVAESASVSQTGRTVRITVSDAFGEVVGANVIVKGTTIGNTTDADGKVTLRDVPEDAVIVVSYIGYVSQEVHSGSRTELNVLLKEDLQALDEVVVVGFAKQKKANLTGSVSSIKMQEILGDRPIATTGNLLQGTIPGLQATVGSGEPGADFEFNIRGITSINGGSPLIVVDNVPFTGAIELLNPEDIESVTVLKDGGAAAIYGAKSTFGVILITTKGAQLNQKFQLNYHNNFSFSSPWELPEKADPYSAMKAFTDMGLRTLYTGHSVEEWMGYLESYRANPSLYPDGYVINAQGTRYSLRETDILGDFFGTGFERKHDVTVSGGGQDMSYRISFGYAGQDGVMASDKDAFERYNFRTFLNSKFTNWLTGQVDMSYVKSDKTLPNIADYQWAVSYPSYVEMMDLDINGETLPAGSPSNLAKLGGTNKNAGSQNRITGKLIATPVKGLTINAEYTFDDLRRTQTDYNKKVRVTNPPKYEVDVRGEYSTLTKTQYQTTLNVWNVYGSYEKSFGRHHLTALLGFNQDTYYYEKTKNVGKDFISDELPSFSLAQDWEPITDSYEEYNTRGYFGRINYDYDSRYLLELNGRYDGSSKYRQENRWGFFPSVSLGWRIMQESFMEPLREYIPELKVRASYSTIGNQNVDPYLFNPNMEGIKAVWIVGGSRPTTLKTPGLVTDNFTWETVETSNLGVDISLLKNRFQANVDIYRRNTKDMLTKAVELPAVVGADAPQQNVADLRSDGFELELKWNDRIEKVSYHIGFNIYDYTSKITKYDNKTGLFYQQNSAQDDKRYREGMKIGEIWGYTFDRFYTENDFTDGKLNEGIPYVRGTTPNPGDVLFVDYDEDGVISTGALTTEDPGDLKIVGNSSLRWQYGITGGLSWNNISFSFIMQGVGKRDVWLNNQLTRPFQYEYGTIYAHQLNYWTPENPNAQFPRLYSLGSRNGNYSANFSCSDRYLDNGAYLRVKNLTLGYTLPKNIIEGCRLENVRIYGSVENPFIFNHLPKGLDPTLSDVSQGMGYPIMRTYSFGVSVTL
jgi:TonB-linked SusC/RagA family outer membrane protein